jgi:glycerol-3-phosphate dehydrogenase
MVSVLGGKWTTYRAMAQDAVEQVWLDAHHACVAQSIHRAPPPPRPRRRPCAQWAAVHGRGLEPSRTLNMQLLGADR